MNKKSIVEIYALAVCFICAAFFSIFASLGVYAVVKMTNPGLTLPHYEYNYHQDNEQFLERKLANFPKDYDNPYKNMSQAQLTQTRERSFQTALAAERRNGIQSLLRTIIAAIVLSLMFGVHWIIAKKARRDDAKITPASAGQ